MRAEQPRDALPPPVAQLQADVQRVTSSAQQQPSLSAPTQLAQATHEQHCQQDVSAAMQPLWRSLSVTQSGDDAAVGRCVSLLDVLYKRGSAQARALIECKRAELELQQRQSSVRAVRSAEAAAATSAHAHMQQQQQQMRLHDERTRVHVSSELSALSWVQQYKAALRALADGQQSAEARVDDGASSGAA